MIRGYTFDGFAYCTVVGALVKTCRIEEASHYMERMVNTGIGIEMTSYNAPINLNCKGSKLEVACEILDEMDKV